MRKPSSHLRAGLEKQSIWSGGDRALAVGSRSARSSFRHRAHGHPRRRQQRFGQERRIDTRLGSSPCGDGPNWPKTHTRIPPSTSSGPERCTATGYRAILHGECALGALNDLFGFPSGSVRVGGHAPAQGVHPSAVKAPCARNADLPVGRSLSTTPSPKPHVPQSAGVRAEGPRGGQSGWNSRVDKAS